MALLQIEDPSAAPVAVGIDLGTTHSVVAYVASTGAPVAIYDCDGQALVPSVVRYRDDGGVEVGEDAAKKAVLFPNQTISSAKRWMGRAASDHSAEELRHVRLSEGDSLVRFAVSDDRSVSPVEVSADILRALRNRTIEELGDIGGVVITVPAYFDDAQRQATKDAAKLAGLNVLRLLNEPTAAALAYGLREKRNGTFLVYDLGGGTFDVTLLSLDDGVFQVRATGGDSLLGGDDFDRALLADMAKRNELDTANFDAADMRSLMQCAREVKHRLTEKSRTELRWQRPSSGEEHTFVVSRAMFEAATEALVERTLKVCRQVLADAEVEATSLDGVILVGGATRMPVVRRSTEAFFGMPPLANIDPDLVVSMGAAIQAELLASSEPREDVLLLDVLPLSLGVETMGGVVERILPRNTPIPTAAAQVFTTYADGQTGFELHVVQGERELAPDCRSLARFTLRGIPPMAAGLARLEVRFEVDADGILNVTAREQTTGIEQSVEVKPSHGLSDEQMEAMLIAAFENAESDVQRRMLAERRIEARRLIEATQRAIAADRDLLESDELEEIGQGMARLAETMAGDDPEAIADAVDELDRVSKPFAGRRMDRSIRRALSGRSLDAVEQETAHAEGIEAHLGDEGKGE